MSYRSYRESALKCLDHELWESMICSMWESFAQEVERTRLETHSSKETGRADGKKNTARNTQLKQVSRHASKQAGRKTGRRADLNSRVPRPRGENALPLTASMLARRLFRPFVKSQARHTILWHQNQPTEQPTKPMDGGEEKGMHRGGGGGGGEAKGLNRKARRAVGVHSIGEMYSISCMAVVVSP